MKTTLRYETFIYIPDPKKKRKDIVVTLIIILVGILLLGLFAAGFPGVGIFAGITTAAALYQIKKENARGKAARRHGNLIDRLIISTETITFSKYDVPLSELQSLEIDAEDYAGRTYEYFFSSIGVENRINFRYKEKNYSFQFIINNRQELQLVKSIERAILNENLR